MQNKIIKKAKYCGLPNKAHIIKCHFLKRLSLLWQIICYFFRRHLLLWQIVLICNGNNYYRIILDAKSSFCHCDHNCCKNRFFAMAFVTDANVLTQKAYFLVVNSLPIICKKFRTQI